MDPELQLYMQEKQQKQDYLRDEIANKGYDPVEFAQYIDSKKCKSYSRSNNRMWYREWNGY